ncbi:hypothetical protein IKE82_01440 [Candidatus Saccharibacteria bacterium]|nr:hypothetical protein [Candidatus Saccharibacteria bacterium]
MKSKSLKTAIIILTAVFGLSLIGFVPTAYTDDVCSNANINEEVRKAAGCSGINQNQIVDTITGILNGIIGVSGLIAVIFVVIGGINYITSTGDSNKLEKARKTILYAAIGLVITVLAFAIVNFVIKNIIGGFSV